MKTYATKKADLERKWFLVDANGLVLGRLASEVAKILRGKHKTVFTRHLDVGDCVVVVNAEKVRFTGKKLEQKSYFRHSGYPGGQKVIRLDKLLKEKPVRIVEYAVKGMLPHNSLGRHQFKKLKVYVGPEHPHQAQQPEKLEL